MIVVCGENLIDFIQEEADGLPVYRANPGGSPFNTAMAMGRQGADVGYVTPISDDNLGQLLRATIEASDVRCLAPANGKPTSLAVVSKVDGQPSYQFYRDDTAERQVDPDTLKACLPVDPDVLQVGSLAIANGADAQAYAALAEDVAARGLAVTFDPNIRAAFIHDRADYMERFTRVADAARLIKLSDEDLEWLAPDRDMMAAARDLFARHSPNVLVLTKGADGAVAITGEGEVSVPAAPLTQKGDTVGAGDTFMGTLIVGLLGAGLLAPDARPTPDTVAPFLTRAAMAAAINCSRIGCNPPTVAELDAAL